MHLWDQLFFRWVFLDEKMGRQAKQANEGQNEGVEMFEFIMLFTNTSCALKEARHPERR